MVGGSYVARNYRAAAEGGRIVQIAFRDKPKAEVDFTLLMTKRLIHTGSTLRPRTAAEKGAIAAALALRVWPLLAAGEVRPVIDRIFPLERAADAHHRMESGEHVGKIVLSVGRRHDRSRRGGSRAAAAPSHVLGETLDTLSVDDLRERIAALRAEIVRLEGAMAAKQASRQAADAFFKRRAQPACLSQPRLSRGRCRPRS